MADFDETRADYRGVAQKVAAGRDALVAASERVRALEKQLEQAARRTGPATEDGGEQVKLRGELRNARENLAGARADLFDVNEALISAAVNFSAFADPVKGAGRLSDSTPIALFPLRIETRYKTIAPVGGAPHQQLWVRVFPDDILVDSFQPEISEAELNNLGIYWTCLLYTSRCV